MLNKKTVQNQLYLKLIDSNIPQISARYVAMKLQELNVETIKTVKEIAPLNFELTTDSKNYIITLHIIDLPDAEIKEIK